ncbi:MAG: DNA polymerase-3 subunit alpha [Saprospiraceae bacterium]|jgi:DNA polymerase-3 subunit alpha
MYLIFDTETTGLPRDWNAPLTDTDNWPRCVQLAWQLHDEWGVLIEQKDYLVKPEGYDIPYDAEKIHGISTELAVEQGLDLQFVLDEFHKALKQTKFLVGQNVKFDLNIVGCELHRKQFESNFLELDVLDTCTETTAKLCQIPGGRGGKFKLPTLTELHKYLFGKAFSDAHNASADVEATTKCFFELMRLNNFTQQELDAEPSYLTEYQKRNPTQIGSYGISHLNLKDASAKIKARDRKSDGISTEQAQQNLERIADVRFAHLHNHTQFSILQSTSKISALLEKAVKENISAVAMTDFGNMMAAFNFVKAFNAHNEGVLDRKAEAEKVDEEFNEQEIKAIIGCELFVCKDHKDKSKKDNGFLTPLLAKNKKGYHELAKLSSQGFIDGFYYVPRVDRELVMKHAGDIIVTTGGMSGEVPWLLLNVGEAQAEEAFVWWKEQFGDDFYIELNRHGLEEEVRVNEVLMKFAKKYDVKYFAANENFYVEQSDSTAHDILLCVKDGEKQSTPVGRGRGFRNGMPNNEFFFKGSDEMKELFKDLPEAIECTQEIVDKIESFVLYSNVLLPKFDIPEEFIDPEDEKTGGTNGENAFLRHLTYEGAKERYEEITEDIRERLDFELSVIEKTGYPGYFLIVQDFIAAAREMGVSVGPGRGSAAGSAVAYCTKITNIDPLKYDLLFERFLNPERVSMPDIDIDFDDEGRGRVIQYVIDKYGSSQVAQIITYGTMAAKSSIRDTGRVLDLPLPDTDRIAKLIPDMKLNKMFNMSEEDLSKKLNPDQLEMARELKSISKNENLEGQTVRQAISLEGSMRNTGTHACGVIITPDDIRQYVPVALVKDSEMWCTQFDNAVVENAGLLKMDFLGLKTLTLIKDAVRIIKDRHGIEIVPDDIPLDDVKTYELFQRGETVGIFQYESPGMQKHLKALKPTVFGDLIAMNALYRPGPIEYIPSFIDRKHGDEEITYDLEGMEEYLGETYGITVYQEQVMLLSQKLAGFTKGQADTLRKAMGKKILSMLEEMRPKFLAGGIERGHDEKVLEKVWKDWEAFASYAFNKSHSTCYAWIAYQTAYLKAHYPAEYMASVLSNNMNDIKQVTFFMEECRRSGIPVLGPDINESSLKFTVNPKGEVRFGMAAVKGVGAGAVESILEERKENGHFSDIFDLTSRVNLRTANKRCMENLAYAGAFDGFDGSHRAQYFFKNNERDTSFLEKAIKYGAQHQSESGSTQQSLFGEGSAVELPKIPTPVCEPWTGVYALKHEKDVVGIFISGHPLDDYKLEVDAFCNANLDQYNSDPKILVGKDLTFAAIVSEAAERMSKKGNMFGVLTLADYTDSSTFFLFGDSYLKFRHFLVEGAMVYVKGKVEARRYDENQLDFKINNIELLPDMRDKLVKRVNIAVDVADMDKVLLDDLFNAFEQHPGKCDVKFMVSDKEQKGYEVSLSSSKYKVNPSNDLFNVLKAHEFLRVSVK